MNPKGLRTGLLIVKQPERLARRSVGRCYAFVSALALADDAAYHMLQCGVKSQKRDRHLARKLHSVHALFSQREHDIVDFTEDFRKTIQINGLEGRMEGFKDMSWLALDLAGVYVLYRGVELLYVGKSTHVPSRVRTHKKSAVIPFDRVEVRLCGERAMHGLETALIYEHCPPYNKQDRPAVGVKLMDIDLEALGLTSRPLLKVVR